MLQRKPSSAFILTIAMSAAAAAASDQAWMAHRGLTRIQLNAEWLDANHPVGIAVTDGRSLVPAGSQVSLDLLGATSFEIWSTRGVLDGFNGGALHHEFGIVLISDRAQVPFGSLALLATDEGFRIQPDEKSLSAAVLEMIDVKFGFDHAGGQMFVEASEIRISPALADALGHAELAGQSIGTLTSAANLELVRDDSEAIPLDPDGGTAGGNNGTDCWNTGEPLVGPDVIVGVLYNVANYNQIGGVDAFSVGTISCNIGSQNLLWISSTNQHPVIGQNVFRLKNGRFEHIGQSWLKHGFTALTDNDCGCGCNGVGGSQLGVGCSDPYSAGLNGSQGGLGPKYEVNASTGFFTYPFTHGNQGSTGDSIYKRLQIAVSDLNPALNGGGQYFIEGQYVTPDDAAAGNKDNNCSYRAVVFTDANSDGDWDVAFAAGSSTMRERAGIRAWKDTDPSVTESDVQIPSDGLVIVSSSATSLGGGMYHYEYAVQNINSDRSIGSFSVPISPGTFVQNVGFHDVAYHSGEPFDGTDWSAAVTSSAVTWSTTPYSTNPNANALRWGTLYNFRFDANVAPVSLSVTLGVFKPGSPTSVTATAVVPAGVPPVCGNGTVEAGEECDPPNGVHCDSFCQWICGDGVTQSGEECDDGNTVNTDGCTNACRLPACPDGFVQAGEQCDDGNLIANDGCTNNCTLPVCGDGVTQTAIGEQCDDGNTVSGDGCSATCQSESNNLCTGGALITDGSYPFSTLDATTDGPVPTCEFSAACANDIWYNYTATCTGSVTVSTCNTASYDTVIVIYDGCACGPWNQMGCDDDTNGCGGHTSRLTVPVTQNNCYKIRLGGYTGSSRGTGTVSVTCTGTVCGNGLLESGEQCDPPNGITCDSSCQRIPVCGDGLIDAGETCDDGNTLSGDGCSGTCQTEGPAPNNQCVNAIAIGEGTRGINTVGATTDGPNETLGNCGKFGYTQVGNDIWFCYSPTCNGTATVSLCGSNYDSKLAVYNGCICPISASAIACNDDSCGLQSELSFTAAIGGSYLIRVGGYQGNTGTGAMTVTCAPSGCQSHDVCNDNNLCTTDTCQGGTCVNAFNSNPCNDGDACTTGDECAGGACVGGPPPPCPPGSPGCTDCNANGARDDCEGLADCDGNGYPDICEYTDCNSNGIADICDIHNGSEVDCDGGPIGSPAAGGTRFTSTCAGCHGPTGTGGFGPNIRNRSRVDIWNRLRPPTDHPGGAFPQYTQQNYADLEAYLSDTGGRGRPDRIPDSCQVLDDCDGDGTSDACELEEGTQVDLDHNGIPDTCVCKTNADCDDGDYCNGTETCVSGACVSGPHPCGEINCNEATDTCGDCNDHADCDDGKFCTGMETCVNHVCVAGTNPCPGQFCSEATSACADCLTNAHCDDGLFCNGAETCNGFACAAGMNPCTDTMCYEPADRCIPDDCDAPFAVGQGSRYLKVIPAPSIGPVALVVYGDPADPDVHCVTRYVQADGRLGSTPVYRTPAEWGEVNVRGTQLIPETTYLVAQDCGAVGFNVMSSTVSAVTWKYGDTANNGIVNLDDILCVLSGFAGIFDVMPSYCQRTGVDLAGCMPNYNIDLDDILAVLGAFGGSGLNCSMPCQ